MLDLVLLASLLAGCERADRSAQRAPDSSGRDQRPITSEATPGREDAALGPSGAAAWIQDYYKAINEGRYRDAYEHWEQKGTASRKSFDEFREGFARTAKVEVTLGAPEPMGAAAGSRYVVVPVRLVAWNRGGGHHVFAGTYTLRRSVVDGATPEQRAWHIYFAKIRGLP